MESDLDLWHGLSFDVWLCISGECSDTEADQTQYCECLLERVDVGKSIEVIARRISKKKKKRSSCWHI